MLKLVFVRKMQKSNSILQKLQSNSINSQRNCHKIAPLVDESQGHVDMSQESALSLEEYKEKEGNESYLKVLKKYQNRNSVHWKNLIFSNLNYVHLLVYQ